MIAHSDKKLLFSQETVRNTYSLNKCLIKAIHYSMLN